MISSTWCNVKATSRHITMLDWYQQWTVVQSGSEVIGPERLVLSWDTHPGTNLVQ